MNSLIFDIQRFCVYDGPGIRTTVFFKGCNMRCKWCHNPESFSPAPDVMYYAEKCTACTACACCPQGAHRFENGVHVFEREKCTACGRCAAVCLSGALEISGKAMTADEIMKIVCKDEKYYRSSGGGVTFSGGEASIHEKPLAELLEKCREKGYHTALETNGVINAETLQKLIPLVDLFLLDVKHTNTDAHRMWTGAPLENVLKTLRALNDKNAKVIMRCPIIPGVNDTNEHFYALRSLIAQFPCISHAEVMAYHDIGKGKWQALGKAYALSDLPTVSGETKRHWEQLLGCETT